MSSDRSANAIKTHRDLEVYQKGFDAAMQIFVGMINHKEKWLLPKRKHK